MKFNTVLLVKASYELYIKILTEVIQSQLMPDCDSALQLIMPGVLVIQQFMRNKLPDQSLGQLFTFNKNLVNKNKSDTNGPHQIQP